MEIWTEAAFIGGHPALDFINTVDDKGKTRDASRIADWTSFATWAEALETYAAGPFTPSELMQLAQPDPAVVPAQLLKDMHQLREDGYRVLSALAQGRDPAAAVLENLETWIKQATERACLNLDPKHPGWMVRADNTDWILDKLALSIEGLIRTEPLARLRECGRCSWLFIDRGRGRGRRWCDMRKCGNRAKSEVFRQRRGG